VEIYNEFRLDGLLLQMLYISWYVGEKNAKNYPNVVCSLIGNGTLSLKNVKGNFW